MYYNSNKESFYLTLCVLNKLIILFIYLPIHIFSIQFNTNTKLPKYSIDKWCLNTHEIMNWNDWIDMWVEN